VGPRRLTLPAFGATGRLFRGKNAGEQAPSRMKQPIARPMLSVVSLPFALFPYVECCFKMVQVLPKLPGTAANAVSPVR
jgi:hypothetical protein